MQKPESALKPPSKLLLMLEGRMFLELGAYYFAKPILKSAPTGDGHPVLVLPGFLTTDSSTRPLRSFLKTLGYAPHGWKLGRNLGLTPELKTGLLDRLKEIQSRYDRKVSIIGWSLGGLYARELARKCPEDVRIVMTLGSPLNHHRQANHVQHLFDVFAQKKGIKASQDPTSQTRKSSPPPVPTTSIYSRSDGIVAWQSCLEQENHYSENIEVRGSHCGLGHNPLVLYAIADRLSLSEGEWSPFNYNGIRRYCYPIRKPKPEVNSSI